MVSIPTAADDVDCRVLSGTPDVIGRAQYALDVKTKVLPVYEQIFDIEYPLPKLDTLVVRHLHICFRVIMIECSKGPRLRRRRHGELGNSLE